MNLNEAKQICDREHKSRADYHAALEWAIAEIERLQGDRSFRDVAASVVEMSDGSMHNYSTLNSLRDYMMMQEAIASCALDNDSEGTQTGRECSVCKHVHNASLRNCPQCGKEYGNGS